MLSNEITVDVLSYLARPTMDAVKITCKWFNAVTESHFAASPRRLLERLVVCEAGLLLLLDESGQWTQAALGSLEQILQHSAVQELHFGCEMSDALFAMLMPHMNHLTDAVCYAPTSYASMDLIERAFTDLLFCRTIHVTKLSVKGVSDKWAYSSAAPFVSLPCVRNCDLLNIYDTSRFFAQEEFRGKLLQWLNDGGEKKTLAFQSNIPYLAFAGISIALNQRFDNATTPSPYELTVINTNPMGRGGSPRRVNTNTNEELVCRYERLQKGGKTTFIRRAIAN